MAFGLSWLVIPHILFSHIRATGIHHVFYLISVSYATSGTAHSTNRPIRVLI